MESLLDVLNTGEGNDGLYDEMPTLFTHSPYFNHDQAIDFLKTKNNTISLLSLNCQSLQSKFDQLQVYLKILEESNCPFSVICLQETWLKDNFDISLLQLEGYNLISKASSCSAHGGVCMYIRGNLEYKILNINTNKDIYDSLFVEIVFDCDEIKKHVIIGNIYRPPRNNAENYEGFNEDLEKVFLEFNRTKDIALMGDFNIDLLKINERTYVKEFFETMTSSGFMPKITFPTRVTDTTATLIDNNFTRTPNHFTKSSAGILNLKISDHKPIFVTLDHLVVQNENRKLIKIYTNTTSAKNKFKDEIASQCNIQHFVTSTNANPNTNYDQLDGIIRNALDKHMPSKLVRCNKHRHKKNSWITKGIIRSIRFRDKLYSKLRSTDPTTEKYNMYKVNLQTYNRILKQNIRLAKKIHYQTCFDKFKKDIKSTWMTIKQIINRSGNISQFPKYFHIDNIDVSDPLEIANKFNLFFTEIGPRLAQSITPPPNKSYRDFLTTPSVANFSFNLVDESTVINTIDKLKPKSSCGADRLSNKLVKLIKHEVSKPVMLIINQSFQTGVFPDKLKLAKVIPIHKKNDKTILDNYRPVSILPSLSKIFEKIMYNQLYNHFLSNKLFFNSQYGFRSQHSTELAALELIDKIVTKMDQNEIPLNIYLDLSKAFDTLDHKILMDKLSYYGITGSSFNLIKDYLSNRRQYVEFEEMTSDFCYIETGVPQGSILGPLLFIIYLNDLVNATKNFYPIIYADDTALSTTLNTFSHSEMTTEESINSELDNISDWFKLNKLSLNPNKTKAMLFYSYQRQVNPVNISIDGTPIEFVESFNYLGIVLDKHLSFQFHINAISLKISKTIGILCKLKNFLPLCTLLTIYNSLILPYLTYGILVWGTNADKMLKLQRKSVRVITNAKYNAHTDPIFKKLGLLKVTDLLALQELKFAFKLENKMLPYYFRTSLFIRHSEIHDHDTRNAQNLTVPTNRHHFVSNSIKYRLPDTYNDCPKHIKSKIYTHSIEGFARYVKKDLIEKYPSSCTVRDCYNNCDSST